LARSGTLRLRSGPNHGRNSALDACALGYIWNSWPTGVSGASQGLDDFDLTLRLFDFSAWRPILGQRFASQCGPPPFDPVSLGLAWLLARWRGWSWPQLVTELHSVERGQGYVRRLGFCPDDLPSASTYRMALHATPPAWVVQCADSLALSLLAYAVLPSRATFPHDPPERGVSVALDSQLVAARSYLRCRHMHANCFRPPAERHCAARPQRNLPQPTDPATGSAHDHAPATDRHHPLGAPARSPFATPATPYTISWRRCLVFLMVIVRSI
jgi:hypothetical protein